MGLFKSLKKIAKRAIKVGAPIAAGAAFGATGEQITRQFLGGAPTVPIVPAVQPARPRFTRAFPMVPGGGGLPALPGLIPPRRRLPPGVTPLMPGGAGCPAGYHPAKDGSGRCVRNRRMNVLNGRAANRAIRRIKGARKMLQRIERQLPRQRARRAPAGHRARLSHD